MMKAMHSIGSVRNQSPMIQPRYLDRNLVLSLVWACLIADSPVAS
jgi:hypothetical protein